MVRFRRISVLVPLIGQREQVQPDGGAGGRLIAGLALSMSGDEPALEREQILVALLREASWQCSLNRDA